MRSSSLCMTRSKSPSRFLIVLLRCRRSLIMGLPHERSATFDPDSSFGSLARFSESQNTRRHISSSLCCGEEWLMLSMSRGCLAMVHGVETRSRGQQQANLGLEHESSFIIIPTFSPMQRGSDRRSIWMIFAALLQEGRHVQMMSRIYICEKSLKSL